ncbi:ABC transporter ATP-binding protein [Ornithinibacillus sp. 4-3]|uniref:ABC transporter ATP-binding protein n=1 Tax=Ornithinibacillus sp. 4-3 TaxID=3231488 RepID=A0AB39HVA3_9BACI
MFTKLLKEPFQYERIPLSKVKRDKKNRPKNMWKTIKRIWSYLTREKGKLTLVISMVLISSALSLLGPFMVGMAIDDFIVQQNVNGLGTLLLLLVGVYLMHSVSVFLQNYWMIGIAQNAVYKMRDELFRQFHQLPISFFDKRKHGELMSRVTNDIDNVNITLNQSVIQIFASVLTLIGTVGVMLYLSPLLTVITMTIIPVMFICMRWITKRTGPLFKLQQNRLGEVNGFVEEMVSGHHVIKTFSQEERVNTDFREKNDQLQLSGFWSMVFSGYIPKVMNMLNFLSFGLIALFGGILAFNGYITVGVIVIFTEYARQFTRPLNELSNQFNVLLSAVAGAERVFHIMDETQEEADEKDAKTLDHIQGRLEFKDVSFAYEKELTLQNINFTAQPGETIAFVGHTGAGKSTIINLVSRFYNYTGGEILLDGIPLKQIKRNDLRSHMAFVLQDPFLFHGTIRENIRYGDLKATDEEIIKAAKNANAHDFIMELPKGYDTILNTDGTGISQGQRQLITIARAFLAKPSLLVLDEATSNIDTITEMKIQQGLKKLMNGRTSLVIAHRLNTIQEADQIIMLENGKIIERGNHDALVEQQGKYNQLYQNQLKRLMP